MLQRGGGQFEESNTKYFFQFNVLRKLHGNMLKRPGFEESVLLLWLNPHWTLAFIFQKRLQPYKEVAQLKQREKGGK